MRVKAILSISLAIVGLITCGKKKNDGNDEEKGDGIDKVGYVSKEVFAEGYINPKEIEPQKVDEISALEIVVKMNELTVYHPPIYSKSTALADDLDTCLRGVVQDMSFTKSHDYAKFTETIDQTECIVSTGVASEMETKVFYAKACESGDFYDVPTVYELLGDISDFQPCQNAQDFENLHQYTVTTQYTAANDLKKGADTYSFSGSEGGPCKIVRNEDERWVTDDCSYLSMRTLEKDGEVTTSNFMLAETSDLQWGTTGNPKYYSSGTMSISYNNWTGTVTFTGAETPPTWELTAGDQTVTGTISD